MNVLQGTLSQAARAGAANPAQELFTSIHAVSREEMSLHASLSVDVGMHFVTF